MKALLFNIHDVILLLTIGVCLLLSAVYALATSWQRQRHARFLLGCFMVASALIAAHTLIFWSEALRYRIFDIFPYIYMPLNTAIFMLGPLLWLVCRYVKGAYQFNLLQLLHFLPAVIAPLYLYLVCFRFDSTTQRELFLNLKLYGQAHTYYVEYISISKVFPLVYGVLCIWFLLYKKPIVAPSARHSTSIIPLNVLVFGFVFIWAWSASTHFLGLIFSLNLSDYMGIACNYIKLLFVLYLTFSALFNLAEDRHAANVVQNEENFSLNEIHKTIIINAMSSKKVFLSPQLTLERLAGIVELSPREVSTIINRGFKQNFHEFVNRYRIEEAKQLLCDPGKSNLNINDIAQYSGFNSKATFNRFFKKFMLLTPSEFRKKHQNPIEG